MGGKWAGAGRRGGGLGYPRPSPPYPNHHNAGAVKPGRGRGRWRATTELGQWKAGGQFPGNPAKRAVPPNATSTNRKVGALLHLPFPGATSHYIPALQCPAPPGPLPLPPTATPAAPRRGESGPGRINWGESPWRARVHLRDKWMSLGNYRKLGAVLAPFLPPRLGVTTRDRWWAQTNQGAE